jgi:hypothetical protein
MVAEFAVDDDALDLDFDPIAPAPPTDAHNPIGRVHPGRLPDRDTASEYSDGVRDKWLSIIRKLSCSDELVAACMDPMLAGDGPTSDKKADSRSSQQKHTAAATGNNRPTSLGPSASSRRVDTLGGSGDGGEDRPPRRPPSTTHHYSTGTKKKNKQPPHSDSSDDDDPTQSTQRVTSPSGGPLFTIVHSIPFYDISFQNQFYLSCSVVFPFLQSSPAAPAMIGIPSSAQLVVTSHRRLPLVRNTHFVICFRMFFFVLKYCIPITTSLLCGHCSLPQPTTSTGRATASGAENNPISVH